MDLILTIVGAILVIAGLIGALLPVLPGPPLSLSGLILLYFTSSHPFGLLFLIFWAIITIILAILDNIIPAWTTKKVGGSAYGVWRCTLGLVIGFFFSPFGILFGPLIGAFSGEFIAGKSTRNALKSAWGSMLGTLLGTALNITAAGMMTFYFFANF